MAHIGEGAVGCSSWQSTLTLPPHYVQFYVYMPRRVTELQNTGPHPQGVKAESCNKALAMQKTRQELCDYHNTQTIRSAEKSAFLLGDIRNPVTWKAGCFG